MIDYNLKFDKNISFFITSIKKMNLSLFITDTDGNIIFTNKAFEELTKYNAEELLNKNPRIFKSNYHDKSFYKILWDTILSGNTWRGEILNKTKTNELIWNNAAIFPLKGQNDKIKYFASIRENINIQKKFSNFIKVDNDTFNSSPIILFNCSPNNFNTNYISQNVDLILGYKQEDFINKQINIFSIIHKDDIKKVKTSIEYNINKLAVNFFNINFRVINKKGNTVYLSGNINLIKNYKNKVISYHGYFLDITEQKKLERKLCLSENKFEMAMDSVGYGLWDWNTKTGNVFYSKNWKTMLGFNKNEVLNHVDVWKSLIHPLDKDRILTLTDKLLNNEIPIYEEEYRLKTKKGNYKWILSKGKVLEWNNNIAIRVIGTHIDLTERKLKEEYKYKTRNLESLGRLAGNIAHNFNNLLMNIQGNIELLKTDDENKEDYIKDIQYSINRARKLSKKMLVFAKGGDPIKTRVNNIDKIIKRRINSLLFIYKDKYKFISKIEDNLLTTDLDINLFTEAIDNIILNSIDAMPNQGTITLKIQNASKIEKQISENDKKYLQISIEDTGVGIKNHIINKIFEPFFSTQPHKKEGVGLTAVNAIITKHNGHIIVNSQENKGTEVKIYLQAYQNNIKHQITTENTFKPQKILIMDDEEIILNILEKFLKKSAYEVETAPNGEETIKKYIKAQEANLPFDIIIMDLIIANGMNGEETIQKLLKIDKNVTAIASSGYSNSKIMSNYKNYGFKAILPKPYKLNDLKELINNL